MEFAKQPSPNNETRSSLPAAEARILEIGCALAVLWVLVVAIVWVWSAGLAQALSGMTLANLVLGRAAGMSLGYAAGLGHRMVIPANLWIETTQVLIVYPLFVLSWRHLLQIRALQRTLGRLHAAAERNQSLVRRYGILGLFVFVCLPFVMTGPVVGSIIGFLIGLRPLVNLAVTLPATALAVAGWAVVLHGLHDWASAYNRYVPFALIVALSLAALVVASWNRSRSDRHR